MLSCDTSIKFIKPVSCNAISAGNFTAVKSSKNIILIANKLLQVVNAAYPDSQLF